MLRYMNRVKLKHQDISEKRDRKPEELSRTCTVTNIINLKVKKKPAMLSYYFHAVQWQPSQRETEK